MVRDDRLTNRLVRHLQAGELGVEGRKLQARIVRIEFWSYDEDKGGMRRQSKLTIRTWGWSPRETQRVVAAALVAEKIKRTQTIRRKHKGGTHVQEVSSVG
jgi:hypothetical protein